MRCGVRRPDIQRVRAQVVPVQVKCHVTLLATLSGLPFSSVPEWMILQTTVPRVPSTRASRTRIVMRYWLPNLMRCESRLRKSASETVGNTVLIASRRPELTAASNA